MKRAIRTAMDRLASASGLLALLEKRARGTLTILTYHRVLADERCVGYPFPSLAMPLSLFAGQVAWLAPRATLVTIAEGLRRLDDPPTTHPLVAISFDDGYADNHALAAPLLRRFGARATFFIVAGLVGTDEELWYDTAARRHTAARHSGADVPASLRDWMAQLKSAEPAARARLIEALPDPPSPRDPLDRVMTPVELTELATQGHEIASHTLTHPILPQLGDADLERELRESRRRLETIVDAPVTGFCYPNGDHDDRVVLACRNAGYSYAATTLPGRNRSGIDPFRLSRLDMNPSRFEGDSILSLRAELSLLRGAFR